MCLWGEASFTAGEQFWCQLLPPLRAAPSVWAESWRAVPPGRGSGSTQCRSWMRAEREWRCAARRRGTAGPPQRANSSRGCWRERNNHVSRGFSLSRTPTACWQTSRVEMPPQGAAFLSPLTSGGLGPLPVPTMSVLCSVVAPPLLACRWLETKGKKLESICFIIAVRSHFDLEDRV